MAKVTGPLFSLAASGTYRSELVFKTNSLGTYVSKPMTAPLVRSLGQQQVSQNVSDLALTWSALPPIDKSDWAVCGATFNLTGYQLWWREWFLQGSSIGTPPVIPCP